MKSCVLLSMDNTEGEHIYDHLLLPPLVDAGWQVKTLSWRAPAINWSDFDIVIIRSTWDYQLHHDEFLKVLETIDQSTAHLENPLSIVCWNINKHYLKDLADKGIGIVPSLWHDQYQAGDLAGYFQQLDTSELVVKPCVSAGAHDTYRIKKAESATVDAELVAKFTNRQFMAQPFMPMIVEEGEFSLFYFDGEFSHSILKTPKENDFRVQEDFGGNLALVTPEPALLEQGTKALAAIEEPLLYARLDFVRHAGSFALMEAELIEPSLYFNLDPDSPQRFVNALNKRLKRMVL